MRIPVLAALALLLFAVPANAVVGGEKVTMEDVPWFGFVGNCGGTLVKPDRMVTAAHCVEASKRF